MALIRTPSAGESEDTRTMPGLIAKRGFGRGRDLIDLFDRQLTGAG